MKNLHEYFLLMFVVGSVAYVGNVIGDGMFSLQSMAGMLILILIAGLGQLLSKLIPLNVPSVVYVIAIGIVASLPQTPWGESVSVFTNEINLLSIATPILAYAGIAIGRSWTDFVTMGWKAMVVSTCVLFGTLIGSAVIAQIVLTFQGII
ncbi:MULTISPECIES: hypothetical protein [Shouchella]|uniref:DUF340 domain-containing protein n=1 Tax=Shouchella hunanensis TaxID=766894 RepID=A0ABY7W3A1_9BACI|nr:MULTISPECIES: hypothetical protein [Shouchella]WDF03442.1 hypothetical protein PQ477_18405 [Shouchella hunanensis]GAF23798.1 membrane protein [Bacillus sp. JCM 19047]